MTSMTSLVEQTDLDFKISVALVYTVCQGPFYELLDINGLQTVPL